MDRVQTLRNSGLTQEVSERVIRYLYSSSEKYTKVEQKISNLEKKPKKVILAFDLNSKPKDLNKSESTLVGEIIELLEVVQMASVEEVTLYFWSSNRDVPIALLRSIPKFRV